MNIIICGAGEVGTHAAEVFSKAGHDITIIDTDDDRLRAISENLDVGTFKGNCAQAEVLREAGAVDSDLLVAATSQDEINLLSASLGKALGARRVIARVHRGTYFEQRGLNYQRHFGIDTLICPEFATATAIARTMRNPAAVAIEHFARGKIEMQEMTVDARSEIIGRPLSELHLPQGTRIGSVMRDKGVFIPDADTRLAPGDGIVLVGNADVFVDARRVFVREHAQRRKVIIMGGPVMAVWLCRILREADWSIRVFEKDRARAEELAERLDWVTVLNADPTERDVALEEHIGQADTFIALGDDDEDNIIGCVLAKTMGVTQVIAVVQRSNYLDLLSHIGVDHPFSPRVVAAREIEQMIDDEPVRVLASLAAGKIDAFRVRVSAGASVLGKPLRQLKISPDFVIAAIRRGENVWVPGADDALEEGDIVLVIGRHGSEKPLKHLLRG
jgi:trk system potassium uptake protein TrkA